ncbi:MAG: polynucleotide 3'-phosphatase, partial [Watsoniomyces obsoletus]
MIQPTTRFGQARPHSDALKGHGEVLYPNGTAGNTSDCSYYITTQCLRDLYGLGNFTADPHDGNLLGISGFLEEYAQYDDWYKFAARYDPVSQAIGRNFSVELINGALNTQHDLMHDSREANLDIQYSLSLSRGTPLKYYGTAGRGLLVPDLDQKYLYNQITNEPYLEALCYLLSLPDDQLPKVLSTSYGENEQSVPRSYAEN